MAAYVIRTHSRQHWAREVSWSERYSDVSMLTYEWYLTGTRTIADLIKKSSLADITRTTIGTM